MKYSINTDCLERKILLHATNTLQPVNGSIELLPLCNMNCDMCYVRLSYTEMNQQGRLRTVDEWIQLAKEMQEAGVLFLLLTGGEPLLYPDFKKLYLELQKLGMILTINTNGTLLDEEWALFFAKHRPRRINITLYGTSEETYKVLCHYPDGYIKTVQAINLLKKHNVDVKINGSITKSNWLDTDAIYNLADDLGVSIHMDTYMIPCVRERSQPFDLQSRLNPKEAAFANFYTLKKELLPNAFQQFIRQVVKTIENPSLPYPRHISCLAANSSFAINWQGEMRPCVTLSEPSIPVFDIGFQSAWNEIIKQSKILILNDTCVNCSLRPICKTCIASAFWETGFYNGLSDYNCQYAHEFYRLLLTEFEEMKKQAIF